MSREGVEITGVCRFLAEERAGSNKSSPWQAQLFHFLGKLGCGGKGEGGGGEEDSLGDEDQEVEEGWHRRRLLALITSFPSQALLAPDAPCCLSFFAL